MSLTVENLDIVKRVIFRHYVPNCVFNYISVSLTLSYELFLNDHGSCSRHAMLELNRICKCIRRKNWNKSKIWFLDTDYNYLVLSSYVLTLVKYHIIYSVIAKLKSSFERAKVRNYWSDLKKVYFSSKFI